MSYLESDLIAQAQKLEEKARQLRRKARWGANAATGAVAEELVSRWLNDPLMWGTHGAPSEGKLILIEEDIAAAIRDYVANLNRT